MANADSPLLHIYYAPADRGWVHGRMVRELGLDEGQYRTREDDGLGEQQLQAIERAVDECRFTVLIASSAARWDKLAGFAAGLAQLAGLEGGVPRLIIIARDFTPSSEAERARLSLGQRALVGLDCSDDEQATAALARLRKLLALDAPMDERPACPYPGLARFTAANRDLLFGRDEAKAAIVQRIRAGHSRILVVGPSGSGKSSLIHAAVLPELPPTDHVVQVVPRGGNLAAALRGTIDALEIPELGAAADSYLAAVRGATDAQIEAARTRFAGCSGPRCASADRCRRSARGSLRPRTTRRSMPQGLKEPDVDDHHHHNDYCARCAARSCAHTDLVDTATQESSDVERTRPTGPSMG